MSKTHSKKVNNIEPHNSKTYYVRGMHCASCEVLIEKKILEIPNVTSVDASTGKGQVVVEYENQQPDIHAVNKIFKK